MSIWGIITIINDAGRWEIEANEETDGFYVYLNGEFYGFADDKDEALDLIEEGGLDA